MERYIHLKEIEEHLYCPQLWKQKKDTYKKPLHFFREANQIRERLIASFHPELPNEPDYQQVPFPTAPKKRSYSHIFLFFSIISFIILIWPLDLGFLDSFIYSIIVGSISPFLIQIIENRLYQLKTNEAIQKQSSLKTIYTLQIQQTLLQHEQEREQLLREFTHGDHLFLTESYLRFDQNTSTKMKDRLLIESKIYDDHIQFEIDEQQKKCLVVLNLSKEKLPPYIVIGHKYHLLRLVGQMLIMEQYLPNYKIRGYLRYQNRRKHIYALDYKSIMAFQKALGAVSRGASSRAIDNTYRCVHCQLKSTCPSIKKEAIQYLEQHVY